MDFVGNLKIYCRKSRTDIATSFNTKTNSLFVKVQDELWVDKLSATTQKTKAINQFNITTPLHVYETEKMQ